MLVEKKAKDLGLLIRETFRASSIQGMYKKYGTSVKIEQMSNLWRNSN